MGCQFTKVNVDRRQRSRWKFRQAKHMVNWWGSPTGAHRFAKESAASQRKSGAENVSNQRFLRFFADYFMNNWQ